MNRMYVSCLAALVLPALKLFAANPGAAAEAPAEPRQPVFQLTGDSLGETPGPESRYTVEYRNVENTGGRIGNALLFGGGDSHVRVNKVGKDDFTARLDAPFTIEFWMKPSASAPYNKCAEILNMGGERGPGWRIFYFYRFVALRSGDGSAFREVKNNPNTHPIAPDRWNHIAYVRDGAGTVSMYVNGSRAAVSESPMPIIPAPRYLMIGNYPGKFPYPFTGALDDFRIYRGAATPAEILKDSRALDEKLAIRLDGRLDEEFWRDARVYDGFKVPPQGTAAAAMPTTVKVKSDAHYLYFGVQCAEPDVAALRTAAVRNRPGDVYRDDSIELMLETEGSGAEYYQFVVNPKGYHGQIFRDQGGFMPVPWHNDNYLCAAAIDPAAGRWSVEIAVPYRILNRSPLTGNCSFDVVRNRRSGEKPETSSLSGGMHVPRKFTALPLTTEIAGYGYRFGQVREADARQVQGGRRITLAVEMISGPAGKLELEGTLAAQDGSGDVFRETVKFDYSGGRQEVNLAYRLAKPGKYLLTLSLSDGTAVRSLDAVPLEFDFTLLDVSLREPFYRDSFYAGQDLKSVCGEIRIGLAPDELKSAELVLELRSGERVAAALNIPAPQRENRFSLPLPAQMPPGVYELTAVLKNNGQTSAEAVKTITLLAAAPGSQVIVTPSGLNVNGRAVLPVVWWGGAPVETIAETGGAAILTTYSEKCGEFLDRARQHGMMGGVMLLNNQNFGRYIKGRAVLGDDARQFITAAVREIRNHPALLYYYLADEPEGRGWNLSLSREVYRLIRELDPYHPVVICNNTIAGIYDYREACDIFCSDPYLLPLIKGTVRRPSKRLTGYQDSFMEAQRKAGNGIHLSGLTVQTFNYADFAESHSDTRVPSFIELRCSHYLAIIHGARMFNYYKYGTTDPAAFHTTRSGIHPYPSLVAGTAAMIRELKSLEPVIGSGEEAGGAVKPLTVGIQAAAFQYRGHCYIIAVNGGAAAVDGKLEVASGLPARFKVVSENREISSSANVIADHFKPFDVHIYTTDPDYRDAVSIPAVKKEIEANGGLFEAVYLP